MYVYGSKTSKTGKILSIFEIYLKIYLNLRSISILSKYIFTYIYTFIYLYGSKTCKTCKTLSISEVYLNLMYD